MFEWFVAKKFLFEGQKFFPKGSAKIGVFAVAIGVAVMIIAMATARGLQYEVTKKLESFGGTFTLRPYAPDQSILLDELGALDHHELVKRKQVLVERLGVLRNQKDYAGLLFKGVFEDYDQSIWEAYLTAGEWIDLSNPTSLIVSEEVARRLSVHLGDTVYGLFPKDEASPQQRRFVISGLFNSQYPAFDESVVLASGTMMRQLNQFGPDEVSSVELFVDQSVSADRAYANLIDQMPAHIDVIATRDTQSMLFDWIKLFDMNLFIISLVITIVGGLNIVTSLLSVVFEKAAAIGVLRAIGASEAALRKLFWIQGAYFLGVGLFLGNAIGLGVFGLQHRFRLLRFSDPKEYYVEYIPVKLYALEVVALNLSVFALCAFVLWVVSRIAIRMNISRLIRA